MKKMIQLVLICATLGLFAMPVFASGRLHSDNAVQDQCTDENKAAWYAEFREKKNSDQPRAYEVAKKYVACPNTEAEAQIVTYLKTKFIEPYEAANADIKRKDDLRNLVYTQKDYAKAFTLGQQILAKEPDYFDAYLSLAWAGFASFNAGNKSFSNDGITYAKKAIDMIESGKTPADWKPTPNKADVVARLNYYIAAQKQESAPAEALPYWMKAAASDTFKKDVPTYYNIGLAYESGSYQRQSDDYKAKYGGKDETPESKLALENINQVVDRMLDAYARTVALAGSDAKYKDVKDDAQARLIIWYKFRHPNTKATDAELTAAATAGVNDLVAGVLSKPLPPEPTPLTQLPTPPATPAVTPPGTTPPASGNGATAPGNKNTTATPPKTNPGRP